MDRLRIAACISLLVAVGAGDIRGQGQDPVDGSAGSPDPIAQPTVDRAETNDPVAPRRARLRDLLEKPVVAEALQEGDLTPERLEPALESLSPEEVERIHERAHESRHALHQRVVITAGAGTLALIALILLLL